MSADLFAEFGQGSAPPQPSADQPRTKQSKTNSLIDDFDQYSNEPAEALNGWSQSIPSNFPAAQTTHPISRQPPGFEFFNLPRQDNSDVLFDAATDEVAGDDNDDDDWGDFEGPQSSQAPNQPTSAIAASKAQPTTIPSANKQTPESIDLMDSLSITDPPKNSIAKQSSKKSPGISPISSKPAHDSKWADDADDDWGDFTDGPSPNPPPMKPAQKPTPKPKKAPLNITPQEPAWDDDGFEDWGDFNDRPSTTTPPKPKAPSPIKPHIRSKTKSISGKLQTPNPNIFTANNTPTSPPNVRPTNIPPPSVLLELLVTSLSNLQKQANAAKPPTTPTSTKTSTAATIITTLSTCAHIIAGRQLRWKRDSLLSQSMRIGPAQGRGMKLNTVNKHEDVKEAQDAVVVLELWRERAPLFSTVVQAVGLKPVPPVADPAALKVITARAEQGGIKASHACALCALRRDERVLRVDEGCVNDSFGEWWTEHWGHTACRDFWEGNKHLLGQR